MLGVVGRHVSDKRGLNLFLVLVAVPLRNGSVVDDMSWTTGLVGHVLDRNCEWRGVTKV